MDEQCENDLVEFTTGKEISSNTPADIKVTTSKALWVLIYSLFLGILFVFLFYKKSLGISYLLFLLFMYGFFFWVLRKKISFQWNFGWIVMICVLLLSLSFGYHSNVLLLYINFLLIPFLFVASILLISKQHVYKWSQFAFISEAIKNAFQLPFEYIFYPFKIHWFDYQNKSSKRTCNAVKNVWFGIFISIPLLFIVVWLLSSADVVFSEQLSSFLMHFQNIHLVDIVWQIILVFLVTIMVFSVLWSVWSKKQSKRSSYVPTESFSPKVDSVILLPILLSLCLVYFLFSWIQFAYLFGSFSYSLPEGITYSQYAREGFAQLIFVSIINYVLLLISTFRKDDEKHGIHVIIKGFNTLLVAFTVVLLVSSYLRITLYEAAYGYTYLRILTQVFIVYLFVHFIMMLCKVWIPSFSLMKTFFILSLIAILFVNFMGIDATIAEKNFQRYITTGEFDSNHFATLSFDAIAEYIEFVKKDPWVKDIMFFQQFDEKLRKVQLNSKDIITPWQSFNGSKYKAKKAIDAYLGLPITTSQKISAYSQSPQLLQDDKWIYYVEKNGLYKIQHYGTTSVEILNESYFSPFYLAGDWIYYSLNRPYDPFGLFKIKIDSSENQKIHEDRSTEIIVQEDWIYTISNNVLYKMKTDGTEKTYLQNYIRNINIIDDWIYYIHSADGICKIRTDGTENTMIFPAQAKCMVVVDDWVFYSVQDSLAKVNTDGTHQEEILPLDTLFLEFDHDWLYFSNLDDQAQLYKVRIDGTDLIKLSNNFPLGLSIIDEWVYYIDEHDIRRVQKDGNYDEVFKYEKFARIESSFEHKAQDDEKQ
ncbi:MAG: DUF4173 domain-containing protein [Caldisericia bacterium]|nr:DUF4173 domain-containing protein [Caldisericia bacterium]